MKLYRTLALALALVMVVMLLPGQTAEARGPKGKTIAQEVIDSAGDSGEFSILLTAIQLADPAVLETLSGRGQFTVFAPTNQAFADAFAELATLGYTPDDILGNQALLTDILLYHVARGNRNSNAVLGSSRINTLNGAFLFQDGGALEDALGRSATITGPDAIQASNGVIHVIDNVVLFALP